MAFAFTPGHLASQSFQAQGVGFAQILNIVNTDLKLSALLYDVTGVLNSPVRARIPGLIDIEGSAQFKHDLLAPPYLLPPLITPGVSGVAFWGLAPGRVFQLPIIMESLHFATQIDKEVIWDYACKANSLQGLLVYPAL